MARVFLTGSSDGLGLMAVKLLIEQGHEVVLHGRNDRRCRDALAAARGAKEGLRARFCVPSSSAPISRQYPATSAARIAVRRRTEAIASDEITSVKNTPKPALTQAVGSGGGWSAWAAAVRVGAPCD